MFFSERLGRLAFVLPDSNLTGSVYVEPSSMSKVTSTFDLARALGVMGIKPALFHTLNMDFKGIFNHCTIHW
jgi:hypothetical protein